MITFFIGNGFDLQVGLRTRYIDVYQAYKNINRLNPEIRDIMLDHFNNPSENWSDFETGIYENANKFKSIEELRLCVEDFRSFIKMYIRKEDEEAIKQFSNLPKEVIIQETVYSLDNFWKYMPPNDSRVLEGIIGSRQTINFISLNYTHILSKLIGENSSGEYIVSDIHYHFGEIVQPHGSYNYGLTLGADNISQFEELEINISPSDSRSLIKKAFIAAYDNEPMRKADYFLNNSGLIVIFGASLGDSDLSWRIKLFNWLKNGRGHIIKCNKPNELFRPDDDSRMLDLIEKHKIAFLSTLGFKEEEMDEYLNRVHIPLDQNIFRYSILFNG